MGMSGVADLPGIGAPGAAREVADFLGRTPERELAELLTFAELRDDGEMEAVESVAAADDTAEREAAAELERRQAQERAVEQRVVAAREEGRRLAQREFDDALAAGLTEERRRLERLRGEFARDRQRFFAAAEGQVVKLALAVAEKVLAREVASDGLHLRSTVKAALARVQENSATRLLVAVEDVPAWQAMFGRESSGKLTIVGDEQMERGDCVLETTVGRVAMGVDVQLQEITRGFAEMLQTPVEAVEPVPAEASAPQAGGY
jgi:flagellar assembly protein FliH